MDFNDVAYMPHENFELVLIQFFNLLIYFLIDSE